MKSFVTSDAARVPAGSSSIRVSVVLAVAILSLMAGVWNPVRRAEASALLIGFEVGSDDPLTASTPLPPATEPVAAPLVATSIPSPDPVSDKVGASVGEFRVDESGQLSYTMPIYVPPGTSGVAPKIALIYNSQSGMSPLGKGWNLAGLSSITRCRATREAGDFFDANGNPLDGNAPPVNFSASDKFCLDGQRLIAMSGATYGGPGAEYRLELDPFTRVYSRGGVNTADDTYTGPQYFEVQRKDGSTSTYGNTTDSRLLRNGCTGGAACAQRALTWALNRMEDSTGNYIDYVYALSPGGVDASGEQVISAIRYTGKRVLSGQVGTAKSPYAQARFTYDTVSTAERRIGYQAGSQFTQSQRLSGIVVEDLIDTGTPRVLRHYRPQYVASPSLSGSSVLASVQECRDDSANVVCYPPTTFAWSAAQYRFDVGAEQTPSAANFANLASFKLGDVDGDGRLDIVWWKNSDGCLNGTSKLYVGFADRASGQISLDTRPTNLCAPRNLLDNDDAWQLIDYNGDGRDDLMLAGAAGANWIVRPATAGVGNRATPFNLAVDLLANDGIAIAVPSDDYRRGQLADFNGDGLLDFMYPAQIGGSASYGAIHVRFLERLSATRYGFSAAHQLDAQWLSTDPCSSQTGGGNPGDLIECSFDFFSVPRTRGGLLVEFNGDGRADILFRIARIYEPGGSIESAGTSGAVFASDEMLAAVTPNVVRRDAWGAFVAGERLPAQGSAPPRFILRQIWQEGTAANGGSLPSNSTGMRLADFNGDGLTDLFYSTAVAGEYRYRLGTGVDFTPAQSVTGLTYGAAAQFADINGDNAADLLVPSGDTSGAFQLRRWQTGASGTSGSFATATALPGGGATIGPLASWTHLFADLDGDGVTDFARLEVAGTGAASSFLYTSRGGVGHRHRPREVMTQITNGYGAATVVDYQPLTNRDVYTRDSGSRDSKVWGRGSPVHDVLAPIYVVAQATSSAPRLGSPSATSTVHYRYAGAKLQGGGRGFLGFHSIVTYDSNDADVDDPQHVSVQTLYLQEFPYIGSALATTKRVGTSTFSPSACNGDIETTTRNCFFDVATGGPADPIGTTVSFAGNAWGCIGTGAPNICPEPWGAAGRCPLTNTLEALHGELQAGPRRSTAVELLGGRQQPVFAFLQGSTEISYDLGSKTSVATTNNVMCYGDDYGNATNTITENYEGLDSSGVLAARSVSTQTYLNDLAAWRLGRLDASSVEFERPGQNALTRFSNFTYDLTGAKTGLLLSERVQKDIGADQDLRTRYVLDEYGNRTIVFTCSSDIPSSSCDGASDVALVKQRPTASNGDPTISAHRYVRAEYDNRGRFMTRMRAPYFNGSATGNQAIEQTTREVLERNEFGDVSAVSDANGRRSGAVFGTLGRPYVQWAQTGADLTVYTTAVTTLRWCQGAGPASEPKVSCPAGAIFRTQIVGDGAATSWTYHDVLGRETLKVAQTFNQGVAGKDLAGACIAYDAHGRPVSQTEPGFLDGSGEPDFVANGSFCTMGRPSAKTYYDVLGRVTDAVGPDQATVSTQYNGLVTTITDPRSKSTVQTRNALGEVVATRDPGATDDPGDDLVVTNEYGVAGDLVRVKRNSGNGDISDEVVYDGFGRKVSQTDPDGGTRTYAYNAAGELIRSTDAKGQVTRQYFDALGRLWKRSTSGGCASDTIFCNGFEDSQSTIAVVDTYVFDTAANGVGLIASSVRVEGGVETFRRSQSYDVIGRPSTRSTTFDNTVWSETTTYDALGRVWTQQDASGQILTSVFSNRGFVQALDDSRVGGGRLYEVFETNARGQVVRERRGNTGVLDTVRSYDTNTGRVDTICSGTNCALQDWNYDFDSNGNLTQRMRNAQRSPTQIDREEFAYDNLNRLEDRDDYEAWRNDDVGRRDVDDLRQARQRLQQGRPGIHVLPA
ncbi:FG-GAP-like repeat-containing protein [Tahibacter soli]|uniref:FG-GAP-like repeat-containing protein n=1 Tax=Tahibacter soli TaxID=2983605 RepID=A0A9X3YQB2_9GAMM|nr:FG-GAP-like repeat-containing protein [Tahibacter soli]MDC8014963.1 FG-GAP-like repeat-containing protein [Tahibacter soli]